MQNTIEASKKQALDSLCLITGTELGRVLGFGGDTHEFRHWRDKCGIAPVPGREKYFDPKLVRHRLDQLQGLLPMEKPNGPVSLVEQRRARRAA